MVTLGTSVLVLPDKLPERTPSGLLVIPKTSKELLPEIGTVIQVGRACRTIKSGDRVMFPRKTCSVISIDGVDHYFTSEHKIMIATKKKKI